MTATAVKPKPFLKWAGGKRRILPQVERYLPSPNSYLQYFEPFLGGGTLFFHLLPKYSVLSDVNPELINAYKTVRDDAGLLIEVLQAHDRQHSKEHYYSVRSELPTDEITRAARFIYLNKTCFNGLYRVNRAGEFNVPMGDYKNPLICDREGILAASEALKPASLLLGDFKYFDDHVGAMSFVYLDPPYIPASATANFTAYDSSGFTLENQRQLAQKMARLHSLGAKVMLSNSDTPLSREIYSIEGFTIHEIKAQRSISAKGGDRKVVGEILVTNYQP